MIKIIFIFSMTISLIRYMRLSKDIKVWTKDFEILNSKLDYSIKELKYPSSLILTKEKR